MITISYATAITIFILSFILFFIFLYKTYKSYNPFKKKISLPYVSLTIISLFIAIFILVADFRTKNVNEYNEEKIAVKSVVLESYAKNTNEYYEADISDEEFIRQNLSNCRIIITLENDEKYKYSYDDFCKKVRYDKTASVGYLKNLTDCKMVFAKGFLNIKKDITLSNTMVLPKETCDKIHDIFYTTRTLKIE